MKEKCVFCHSRDTNIRLGDVYNYNNLTLHYFCMLLSAYITQSGRDDEGILGFTEEDIVNEVERGKKIICKYCNKRGATLECKKRSCTNVFHLPCALKKGMVPVFKDDYPCWCSKHAKRPALGLRRYNTKKETFNCNICLMPLEIKNEKNDLIKSGCCKKLCLMHRECAQKYANNAGYALKCPICQNKNKFAKSLKLSGVFVPERDSSWELENQFQDLYVPGGCEFEFCMGKSRTQDNVNTLLELMRCERCNAASAHRICAEMNIIECVYICICCSEAEKKKKEECKKQTVAVWRDMDCDRQECETANADNIIRDDTNDRNNSWAMEPLVLSDSDENISK